MSGNRHDLTNARVGRMTSFLRNARVWMPFEFTKTTQEIFRVEGWILIWFRLLIQNDGTIQIKYNQNINIKCHHFQNSMEPDQDDIFNP